MKKAIFLDRDGVLNKTIFREGKARAPYTLEEFSLFQGVEEAIETLKGLQYLLIVVTNQPDVARGWVSQEMVQAVNNRIKEMIYLDDIMICYHTDKDQCLCRKPRPGMIFDAQRKWDIDLSISFMIGDRHSDVLAGKNAGCKTILIGEGDHSSDVVADFQADSLLEAAQLIASI